MRTRKVLDERVGNVRITLDVIEGDPGSHDYGIGRQAWFRAIKLVKLFGAETALDHIDQRAELAADRGDYETARRWRDLIAAIHAIQEDERMAGEREH